MRNIVTLALLLINLPALAMSQSKLNCITLNHDISRIEQLADSGIYRNLADITDKQSDKNNALTFDYQETHSYQDYLSYAYEKISRLNPKAKLKCPIETGVTKALNKAVDNLVVTDLLAPFELHAPNSRQVLLLVHGLTDSPYHFHDIATHYHQQGMNVRSLLLPGHSTAAEALTEVSYEEWQKATKFAVSKALADFDQVYLGGFSTGSTLLLDDLLSYSRDLKKIKGVILWMPAFKAKSSVAWAAQVADWIPFLDYTHKSADIDFAKYESFPLNAAAQVYTLMNLLTEKVESATEIPDVPLLTITTEVDTTIETQATIALIAKWHNAKNRRSQQKDTLFYFGDPASLNALPDTVRRIFPSCNHADYCKNILNVAHTAVLNAPSNPHYGWQGNYRNCEYSFGSEHYYACKSTTTPVLGETTQENLEKHPNMQRLTFNPSFEEMIKSTTLFMSN